MKVGSFGRMRRDKRTLTGHDGIILLGPAAVVRERRVHVQQEGHAADVQVQVEALQ